MMTTVSPNARTLILRYEGCPLYPEWPRGASGITLGIGCDIGADPESLWAWEGFLPPAAMLLLRPCRGLQGASAEAALSRVRGIFVPRAASLAIFDNYTLPREVARTKAAFSGAEALPPDSFGALVSLVYNRGGAMHDNSPEDRRKEIRQIRDALPDRAHWKDIPGYLRAMVRLWPQKPTEDNLPGRRLAEARLFEGGLNTTKRS